MINRSIDTFFNNSGSRSLAPRLREAPKAKGLARSGLPRNKYQNRYSFYSYKIVVYIGSNTSRDSNHLPHDSHYDVLITSLKKGCS